MPSPNSKRVRSSPGNDSGQVYAGRCPNKKSFEPFIERDSLLMHLVEFGWKRDWSKSHIHEESFQNKRKGIWARASIVTAKVFSQEPDT
jgi:hypothetical protein